MKEKFFFLSRVIACIALLAFAIGCAKPNDAKVTSDIQAKLAADSGLQDKQITVQSAKGTVTLAGNVDTQAQRDAAAKYAASEPGVKTVINNLQMGPAQAMSEPAPQPESQPENSSSSSKPAPSPKHHKPAAQENQSAQNEASLPAPADQSQSAAANQTPAADPAPVTQSAPPPPPEPAPVTVPSGAVLSVRLNDAISSATAQAGDKFHATLDSPLTVDGNVVVPAHYTVQGHVVNAQSSGKFRGQALLELQLDRIKVGDKSVAIQTDHYSQKTGARGKNTAEKVGVGAAAGAILGGIFGGGKGAAIGGAAGAGAGGGVQAASKAPEIKLPAEKVLTFTLQSSVTLVPTTAPARGGQTLPSPDSQ
ncbi:MAG TPA: BON domain-containing protein [Terriglobales bacterium]|jgi:outer membrane biosynthesis protein TonB